MNQRSGDVRVELSAGLVANSDSLQEMNRSRCYGSGRFLFWLKVVAYAKAFDDFFFDAQRLFIAGQNAA